MTIFMIVFMLMSMVLFFYLVIKIFLMKIEQGFIKDEDGMVNFYFKFTI